MTRGETRNERNDLKRRVESEQPATATGSNGTTRPPASNQQRDPGTLEGQRHPTTNSTSSTQTTRCTPSHKAVCMGLTMTSLGPSRGGGLASLGAAFAPMHFSPTARRPGHATCAGNQAKPCRLQGAPLSLPILCGVAPRTSSTLCSDSLVSSFC